MASSTRSAAAVSPRGRSISTPDSIRAVGLALFWPAYLGADPGTASNTAAAVDVAVQVRKHANVVQLRLLAELHAHVVDDAVLEVDPALECRGDRPARVEEQA